MKNLFSSNLRFLRKKYGKSQTNIALQLNKAHTSIGNWEKQISEPNFEEIEKIARLFEILPAELLYSDLQNAQVMENSDERKFEKNAKVNAQQNAQVNLEKRHLRAKSLNYSEEVPARKTAEQDAIYYAAGEVEKLQAQTIQILQAQLKDKDTIIEAKNQVISMLTAKVEELQASAPVRKKTG